MGKQSRRKKVNKKAHKERQRERRERINDFIDYGDQNEGVVENEQARDMDIHVGQRLFYPIEGGKYRRAVVKAIGDSSYTVLPVDQPDQEDSFVQVQAGDIDVVKDTCEWTLRFKEGDQVVCCCPDGWEPATVTQLWPVDQTRSDGIIPCYRCLKDDPDNSEFPCAAVPRDEDDCIVERPSTFRFSVGDKVLFNGSMAVGCSRDPAWIEGKVIEVDVVGRYECYAVYECAYMDRKKPRTCLIIKDNDEHVAVHDTSPRQRLFEAIEQCCSYEHIDYLVKTSNMDVIGFRDLLVSKAIESASYNALLWLQENATVNLTKIRDSAGNGLLHQISRTSHAERFFREAAESDLRKIGDAPYISFIEYSLDDSLLAKTDSQGRSWLHLLVITGNTRALDLALSPKVGLGWTVSGLLRKLCPIEKPMDVDSLTQDRKGLSVKGTANRLSRYVMTRMIEEFLQWHTLHDLSLNVFFTCFSQRGHYDVLGGDILSHFGDEPSSSVAQRLIRFHREWENCGPPHRRPHTLRNVVHKLSSDGQFHALAWLINEDASLMNCRTSESQTSENRNEFAQLELYVHDDSENWEYLNLVEHAALGNPSAVRTSLDEVDLGLFFGMLEEYASSLDRTKDTRERRTLATFIKERLRQLKNDNMDYGSFARLLKYKLSLLEDDNLLEYRLEVLNYLVKEKGQRPPNVLDIIRWRKCGVLRWLVEGSYVDLDAKAMKSEELSRCRKKLEFLHDEKVPPSMTVGEFLCFAAVEFDDLQSLQWFVGVKRIPLLEAKFHGWNLIHCCAYFGRSEIFLSLRETAKPLVNEMSRRKPWDGLFAAHIAVEKGYTFLADLLLSSGCPVHDEAGQSVFLHAKQSKLAFVCDWGTKKEKPVLLERDIEQLLCLLSSEIHQLGSIRRHLSTSRCMVAERWRDCDYYDTQTPGPLGMTYLDVLRVCCKAGDSEFVVWLCRELTPTNEARFQVYLWKSFWRCDISNSSALDLSDLLVFVQEQENALLCRCLGKGWAQRIRCREPFRDNPLLAFAFLVFQTDPVVMEALRLLRNECLLKGILENVRLAAAERKIKHLFTRGANVSEILDTIEILMSAAAELACMEGRELHSYFPGYFIISAEGKINLDCRIHVDIDDNSGTHPLQGLIEWHGGPTREIETLYVFLAVEGHTALISWILASGRSNWTAEKECDVVRIASFLGHTNVVDIFLRGQTGAELASSEANRFSAAILGAAEAGNLTDLVQYMDECAGMDLPSDPIVHDLESIPVSYDERGERKMVMASSLVGSAMFAYLCGKSTESSNEDGNNGRVEVIEWFLSQKVADISCLLRAVRLMLPDLYEIYSYERCTSLIARFVRELFIDLSCYDEEIRGITSQYTTLLDILVGMKGRDISSITNVLSEWLKLVLEIGVDIQSVEFQQTAFPGPKDLLRKVLSSYQAEQLRNWSQFESLKEGQPFDVIVRAVEEGQFDLAARYRGGLLVSHLASAYDRLDVLEWLVTKKGMPLDAGDGMGQSVLQVAEASNSVSVIKWIVMHTAGSKIAIFVSSHFRGRCAREKTLRLLCSIRTVQAWQRGNTVRKVYRGHLLSLLEESQRFQQSWNGSLSLLATALTDGSEEWTWRSIKQKEHDTMRAEDDLDDAVKFTETAQKLEDAVAKALSEMDLSTECDSDLAADEPDVGIDHDRVEEEHRHQSGSLLATSHSSR